MSPYKMINVFQEVVTKFSKNLWLMGRGDPKDHEKKKDKIEVKKLLIF